VRVGVDGRSLRSSATSRGITRYVHRLLSELASAFPEDEYAVLVPGGRGPFAARLEAAGIELHGPRVDSRLLFASAALAGRPRADRMLGGCDVMWLPAVGPIALSRATRFVLTVHDLSFEHHPRDLGLYDRAWHRIARPRKLARRAERVIAVSEAVRRQLLAEWGLDPESVVSVRSGPGSEPGAAGPLPAGVREPYVLAVGALEPRKRPDVVVEGHARARAAGLAAGLVLVGDGPLRDVLADSQAVVLGFVPDAELEALYSRALALVCASHEEGFAFTPLEAIARGTPAVVSDLPVFEETLGEGALRVPPGDADALATALLRLERDADLRDETLRAGRAALAGLSWTCAAQETRAVLLAAAQGGRHAPAVRA
jgi:glycosyltransferase involved in cell wall biosynthesis